MVLFAEIAKFATMTSAAQGASPCRRVRFSPRKSHKKRPGADYFFERIGDSEHVENQIVGCLDCTEYKEPFKKPARLRGRVHNRGEEEIEDNCYEKTTPFPIAECNLKRISPQQTVQTEYRHHEAK